MPDSTAPADAVPATNLPATRHEAWATRAWLVLLLVLGACGGGGGGGGGGATDTGTSGTLAAVGAAVTPPPTTTVADSGGTSTGSGSTASPSGGSPLGANELAVLIAEGDATSEAIGRAYQRARGIPEANMIRVPVATGSDAISAADFATLKARIDGLLPAGVQASAVTWTAPSRVQGSSCTMSLTSALAFGWDARYCGSCNRTLASPYYNSGSSRPWSDLRIRPAMMLGAATLADAQALIARGLAADGRMAAGASASGWLLRTSDAARSVRYPDFQSLAATPVTGIRWTYVDNASGAGSNVVSGQGDVMFYFTGLSRVPQLTANLYAPGAVADHLTSFAGLLPGANGQMPATDWLAAGLTGSFGTVEEPCNYTEKFPKASVLVDRYQRGETLIEAYWKSVQWPGQGLFVGEPLARPWARL